MTNTQNAIAAFLAKGGNVRKVSANATNGMSNRDWYKAARDETVSRIVDDYSDTEQRDERAREIFGCARANGASESEAMNAMNEAHY